MTQPQGYRGICLPIFAKPRRLATVGTMNISLPDELRDFVEEQVKRGYGTSSEYVRELIRRDQDRLRVRDRRRCFAARCSGRWDLLQEAP